MAPWKASNIWKKYYKYDYEELIKIAIDYLKNYKINYEPGVIKR